MKPGIHCVITHWIRGFIAFRLVRRIRTVMLMVPTSPESGYLGMPPGRGPLVAAPAWGSAQGWGRGAGRGTARGAGTRGGSGARGGNRSGSNLVVM